VTSLPTDLIEALQPFAGSIRSARPVSGGCIANAVKLDADRGRFFLKWGDESTGQRFVAEEAGLRQLRRVSRIIRIPEVIACASTGLSFLLLEWIEEGGSDSKDWRALGKGLAELHRVEGESYGFPSDNFIGRLPQHNQEARRWTDFFRERRLAPQVEMASARGVWKKEWTPSMDRLLVALDTILPENPPRSVLHGDLWRGNCLFDSDSRPVLIDPAAYFGDRETDLAMMALFGGFAVDAFDAYEHAWPLAAGWRERREVYQLYHLINHLNHFGGSYAADVGAIITRY
jgi:protein-ribulosamine 3-kinase